jgi:hypothetical protein
MDDGDYIVFVEADREPSVAQNIIDMMEDILNLTDQELSDWRVIFKSSSQEHELNLENIKQHVPLTSEEYIRRFGKREKDLDEMRAAAGVPITTKAPKNEFTQSIRSLAGIL